MRSRKGDKFLAVFFPEILLNYDLSARSGIKMIVVFDYGFLRRLENVRSPGQEPVGFESFMTCVDWMRV